MTYRLTHPPHEEQQAIADEFVEQYMSRLPYVNGVGLAVPRRQLWRARYRLPCTWGLYVQVSPGYFAQAQEDLPATFGGYSVRIEVGVYVAASTATTEQPSAVRDAS